MCCKAGVELPEESMRELEANNMAALEMQSLERIHLNKDPNKHRSTFNKQVRRGHVLFFWVPLFSFFPVYFTEIEYEKNAHMH